MSQNPQSDYSIDPFTISGWQLNEILDRCQDAFLSQHSSTIRPPYDKPGTIWLDLTTLPGILKWHDGTIDHSIGAITDSVPISTFDAMKIYNANDLVVQGGEIYRAKGLAGPSAFAPTQWQAINDSVPTDTIAVFNTAADLKAADPLNITSGAAVTLGAIVTGDGGEGLWYWDVGDTTLENIGTVIADAGDTGRWKRAGTLQPINLAWFGISGGCDIYTQLMAAINTIANKERKANSKTKFLEFGTRAIFIPEGKYLLSHKVVVDSERDAYFVGEPGITATWIRYTGPGHVGFQFDPRYRTSIGMEKMVLENMSVAVIGSSQGRIDFRKMSFMFPQENGLWFVDAPQYYDGDTIVAGAFNKTGNSGTNTVGFHVDECYFQGGSKHHLVVDATTALLGKIGRCRFFGSDQASMVIRGNFNRIADCDFMGVALANRATQPYLWIDTSAPHSQPFVDYFENCRFGSEEFKILTIDYAPPFTSVILGGLTESVGRITDIHFENCQFTGSATTNSHHAFKINTNLSNSTFKGLFFQNYDDYLFSVNPIATLTKASNRISDVKIGVTVTGALLHPSDREGFILDTEIFVSGNKPTIAGGSNGGIGSMFIVDDNSTDGAGYITINIGTAAVGFSNIANLTYTLPYTGLAAPAVILQPQNKDAADIGWYVISKNSGFTINANAALTDGKSYRFYYLVVGRRVD